MLTKDSFYQKLRKIIPATSFCIAFSGGLDSSVLLHLFSELSSEDPNIRIRAVHINHGLSSNANEWESICKKVCEAYKVPLIVRQLQLKKTPKISLEESARKKRYVVFQEILQDDEILVTAHHQNDQAETLLLQLFRGAGPKGLASMPIITPFVGGYLMRPLLSYSREALNQYALQENLTWLEDESNENLNFDRNYVRREILPLIQSRWPSVTENLARSAKHCAEANSYIDSQVMPLFLKTYIESNRTLSITALKDYDSQTQSYIIRYWLQKLGFPLPSTQKLKLLQEEIVHSRGDAKPLLKWQQVEIRRYDNQLYAINPLPEHDPSLIIHWDLKNEITLPNGFQICPKSVERLGVIIENLKDVTIRFRQGGERCQLKNRKHSHSLKKLLQEWKIPPWLRNRIPLLYSQTELKAIIGYVACD